MRTAIALFTALLLLTACSDAKDKKAAREKKISEYKTELKALNAEYAAMRELPEHKAVRLASFNAQKALRSAKKRGDTAAMEEAQAAYDETSAAADVVFAQEAALERRRLDLRDKILDLGGTP